jgi:hypothetical protein
VCDSAVILAGGTVAVSGALRDLTGTVEGLVVEVDGAAPEAATLTAALRDRGCVVETNDNDRVLTVRPAAGTSDDLHDVVRDTLVVTGIGVRRLTSIRVRLEDVFMQANDRALAAAAAQHEDGR